MFIFTLDLVRVAEAIIWPAEAGPEPANHVFLLEAVWEPDQTAASDSVLKGASDGANNRCEDNNSSRTSTKTTTKTTAKTTAKTSSQDQHRDHRRDQPYQHPYQHQDQHRDHRRDYRQDHRRDHRWNRVNSIIKERKPNCSIPKITKKEPPSFIVLLFQFLFLALSIWSTEKFFSPERFSRWKLLK